MSLGATAAIALAGSAVALHAAPPPEETPARLSQPAPKFTLLLRGKPPQPVSLLSIAAADPARAAQIVYLDAAGARQTRPLAEIVALAPSTWVPTPDTILPPEDQNTSDLPVHAIELTDGQRFVGMLADPPRAADKTAEVPVYFKHDRLGAFSFPLDRISRYLYSTRRAEDPAAKALSTSNDTVLLLNEDRLEGLVTRLGPTMSIEIAPVGAAPKAAAAHEPATDIDIRKVALIHLVNPPTLLRTLRVDLADGCIVAADRLNADTESGRLVLRPLAAEANAPQITMELSQLAGVVPDPSRITPLSTLPIAAQSTARDRTGAALAQVLPAADMPLSASDIVLPGPMTVEWAIPPAAASISGYAQMDDRSFAWGDCTLVVSVAPGQAGAPERELGRTRLNATNPTFILSTDLGAIKPGDRLRVRTEAGSRGPIQDRVVLRRMLLLAAPAGG